MRNSINAIVTFGAFTLYYLIMELFINDYAAFILDAKTVTILYGVCYLMVGIGFPLYYLIDKAVHNSTISLVIVYCFAFCSLIASGIVSFTGSHRMLILFALVAHLSAGYVGGAVYSFIAMKMKGSGKIGFSIAIGYASANILQLIAIAILSNLTEDIVDWVERSSLLVCMIVTIMLLPRTNAENNIERTSTSSEQNQSAMKLVCVALSAMALIAFMHGLTDGIITSLHAAEGEYVAYGYPRLFVIPGLLLAGIVSDIKNKSIFNFSVLVAMIISLIAILLFYNPVSNNIATCFVYFFGSFMSIYSVSVFMEIAPNTTRPVLFASAGRAVRYFCAGISIIATSILYHQSSLMALVIIYIALEIALFAVFFFRGYLQISTEPSQEISTQDFKQYNLTEREGEVLTLLLQGKATSDIASELYLSEHTVRSHISNLLAKTNSKSRVEMITNIKK